MLKKITIIFDPRNTALIVDRMSEAIQNSVDFRIETIQEPNSVVSAPRKKHRDPDMTTPEAIMSHYSDHSSKEFTKEQASAWLADKGFAPSGASPALSRLNQRGYIGLLKRGRYEFLKPLEEGVSI